MKTFFREVVAAKSDDGPIDSVVSFQPFVDYLRQRAEGEKTVKADFYRQALRQLAEEGVAADIPLEHLAAHQEQFERVFALVSPMLAEEAEFAWGLCPPFQPVVFYGTDALSALLKHLEEEETPALGQPLRTSREQQLQAVYSFVLQRLYG